jgi:hypothetical protein
MRAPPDSDIGPGGEMQVATHQGLTGQRFGRLTVIGPAGSNKHGKRLWLCSCECGRQTTAVGSHLINGHTKSCGCLVADTFLQYNLDHGLAGTRLYGSWLNMMRRCYNPSDAYYEDYGARGVKVCLRWHDLSNFAADMGHPPEGLSIDRINNDGHYSCGKCDECLSNNWPMNCRWATPTEQSRNTRFNRNITFQGETRCLSEWAQRLGIKRNTLDGRLQRGWSVDRAFTTPPQPSKRIYKRKKETTR